MKPLELCLWFVRSLDQVTVLPQSTRLRNDHPTPPRPLVRPVGERDGEARPNPEANRKVGWKRRRWQEYPFVKIQGMDMLACRAVSRGCLLLTMER